LEEFDALIANDATVEKAVHAAIENNLWLLGSGYRLVASNKTLSKMISDWLDKEFVGKRADKRPDLFLAAIGVDRYLLVEFKRPSHPINRDDEGQAIKYRDDIQPLVPDRKIEILMVGGGRAPGVSGHYSTTDSGWRATESSPPRGGKNSNGSSRPLVRKRSRRGARRGLPFDSPNGRWG
jgi:hypothetical protein